MPGDTNPKPVAIFYSYAHEDARFLKDLSASLAPLKRQELVKEWYDGDLSAGQAWEAKIYEQLDAAEVILLLVSRDFINSDFVWGNELKRALDRHAAGQARVIPVIIRPAGWQGWASNWRRAKVRSSAWR